MTVDIYLPGAVSSTDQAFRKYQPCGCGRDGGDPDAGFHTTLKGTAHHTASTYSPHPCFPHREKPGLLMGPKEEM